jgi:hypothetical protein
MQQLRVGDLPAFGWLISFVDNGSLGYMTGITEMRMMT